MKLHGYFRSSAAFRTRIALNLKGIAWESHPVDLHTNENFQPWFLGINPRGLVPVLVHDVDVPSWINSLRARHELLPQRTVTLDVPSSIRDALGLLSERVRPLRAGDYSFNQIGPTGLYMLLSNIPIGERKKRGYYAVGGCGGNIAWHTPDDLMPVADLEILRRDLSVYLTTIVRLLNAPLHPFDYAEAALFTPRLVAAERALTGTRRSRFRSGACRRATRR